MGAAPWKKWAEGLDAQREAVRKRLKKAKLEHHADALLALGRTSAGLRLSPLAVKPAPLGTSRVGGAPDLPAATKGPARQSFVLQIALADVATIGLTPTLPKTGLLSVFVEDDPEGEGDYLEVCTVIFTPAGTPLERKPPASKTLPTYGERQIEIVPYYSLPLANEPAIEKLFEEEECDRYADEVYRETADPPHRLGGHHQDYYVEKATRKHPLLLSLASDEALGFRWGDGDKLEIVVPELAWQTRDFGKARSRCATA